MEEITNSDGRRWYVVQAFSGFEKKVAESLKDHIQRAGLEAKFGDILVPTEEVMEMRGGQKTHYGEKVLPGVCSGQYGAG